MTYPGVGCELGIDTDDTFRVTTLAVVAKTFGVERAFEA
jgi:hypothetical protein